MYLRRFFCAYISENFALQAANNFILSKADIGKISRYFTTFFDFTKSLRKIQNANICLFSGKYFSLAKLHFRNILAAVKVFFGRHFRLSLLASR